MYNVHVPVVVIEVWCVARQGEGKGIGHRQPSLSEVSLEQWYHQTDHLLH